MTEPLTKGAHHIGLTVRDLDEVRKFFCDVLGWNVVREVPSYPAVFVSDGATLLTLWRAADPETAVGFDRRTNVGLHHLAFGVADDQALAEVHTRVSAHPGTAIEFAPEPIGEGATTRHFICAIPGGIRIEFATPFA